MRVWPVWLVILATLAGCSSPDAATSEVTQEALPEIGKLRGLVVDEAITPIDGARVVFMNIELETVTGIDGLFGVDNLPVGPYRLRITKADHDAVEVVTHVAKGDGEPSPEQFMLTRTPGSAPFAVPATHTGWIGCEALLFYILQNCDGGTSTFGPPDNRVLLTQPAGIPRAVHVELAWIPAQEFAKSLTLTYGTCSGVEYCDPQPPSDTFMCTGWGASPLWCRINHTGVERSADGNAHQNLRDAGHGVKPLPGLAIHVGADCANCLPAPYDTWGLGLVVQQEVDIFTWSFYNFEPAEGWSFVDDGEPSP